MPRTSSLFASVIDRAAEALASDPRIPAASRAAFQATASSVLRAQFAALVGGERVYAPKVCVVERQAQRQRIADALARQEPVDAIARREGVSARWVRKLRGTVRP